VEAPADKPVEIALKNVTIKNSLNAGINMKGMARLKAITENLSITGTVTTSAGEGGFPIISTPYGTHNLPEGTYRPNAISAINVNGGGGSNDIINFNLTWKNIGLPYAISDTLYVDGPNTPTLTIEPGVITLWAPRTALQVGTWSPGALVAESKGVTKEDLELGLDLATLDLAAAECADCARNKAIVFGPWTESPRPGTWRGIMFGNGTSDKSKLVGTVVAYGGEDLDGNGAVSVGSWDFGKVRVLVADSLITEAAGYGIYLYPQATLMPGSTGNVITKNKAPVRAIASSVSSLLSDNDYTGNETDAIIIEGDGDLTSKHTWQALNVPYRANRQIWVYGSGASLTLEPGVTIEFGADELLNVGSQGGDLFATGTPDKPITLTGASKRPGYWEGIRVDGRVGEIVLEHVIIEYATHGVTITEDVGRFIENCTFRNNQGYGINIEGEILTDHRPGNTFENNRLGDQAPLYGE